MDTLFDKIFSHSKYNETSLIKKFTGVNSFRKNSDSLLQNMPVEYQQQLLKDSLYSSDFSNPAQSSAFKTNLCGLFKTFNHSMLPNIPKVSPCSDLVQEYNRLISNSVANSISDLNFLLNTIPQRTMEGYCTPLEKTPKRDSVNDHLVVSIADASSPDKKAHFNVMISKTLLKPLNDSKKISNEDCLAQQMANRKAKELQKRSKKRRRRQKKSSSSSTASKDVQKCKVQVNCDASPCSANNEKKCDIVCDVTVSPDSKSVQIVLPDLSSFVVTIESGDDDSDWDTNCEADWLSNDSEFEVSGLFVASFSATNPCSLLTYEPENKLQKQELTLIKAKLKKVNRIWNEQHACVTVKPKSPTLVSFAADEELEEICPVEIYERKGEWEVFATERLRFKKRISELEDVLSPCFQPDHRAKIYSTLYENVL